MYTDFSLFKGSKSDLLEPVNFINIKTNPKTDSAVFDYFDFMRIPFRITFHNAHNGYYEVSLWLLEPKTKFLGSFMKPASSLKCAACVYSTIIEVQDSLY